MHLYLVPAAHAIGLKALGRGPASRIRCDRKSVRAAREHAPGPMAGRGKEHHRSRDGPVILILHFDDRLPRSPLPDVVDRILAFDNMYVEGRLCRQLRKRDQQSQRHSQRVSHLFQNEPTV